MCHHYIEIATALSDMHKVTKPGNEARVPQFKVIIAAVISAIPTSKMKALKCKPLACIG